MNTNRQSRDPFYDEPPRAGGSHTTGNDRGDRNRDQEKQYEKEARAKADQQIHDAEVSKARILEPKGNFNDYLPIFDNPDNQRCERGTQDDGYESDECKYENNHRVRGNELVHNPVEVD